MPRKLKFEEESKVLTVRVPETLFEELKNEFDWVIQYRIQNKLLPSTQLSQLNGLLDEKDDTIDVLKNQLEKLVKT